MGIIGTIGKRSLGKLQRKENISEVYYPKDVSKILVEESYRGYSYRIFSDGSFPTLYIVYDNLLYGSSTFQSGKIKFTKIPHFYYHEYNEMTDYTYEKSSGICHTLNGIKHDAEECIDKLISEETNFINSSNDMKEISLNNNIIKELNEYKEDVRLIKETHPSSIYIELMKNPDTLLDLCKTFIKKCV